MSNNFTRTTEASSLYHDIEKSSTAAIVSNINTEDKKATIQLPKSVKNGIYFIRINDGITIETKQLILYK